MDKRLPDTPKLERSVRRINTKVIYIFAGVFLVVLFIILLQVLTSQSKASAKKTVEATASARANSDAEFRQMLQRLPDNYGATNSPPKPQQRPDPVQPPDPPAAPPPRAHSNGGGGGGYHRAREEDPWAAAAKAERARAADEYWQARKADTEVRVKHAQKEVPSSHSASDSGTRIDLQGARSPYSLAEGTIIPAVLLSKIVSDLPGPILAVVSEHVFDSKAGKYLLVPQGTKLVGEYVSTTTHGQNRAQVIWKRMILPNQKTVNIDQMPGIDRSGSAGVRGDVDNHYEDLFIGLLATSLLSSGLAAAQGNTNPHQQSPQAQIGSAVAQDVTRFGSKVAERNLDIKPTITVESGSKISVFATRNLVLEPYSYE